MLSIYAGSVFVGRLGFGFLLDRLPPLAIAATAFMVPIIGAALLIDGQITHTEALIAAATLGLAAGAEIDIVGFFIARYFGMRHYATLFGVMMSALVIANASGNILYGRVFDMTGGYGNALTWSIGGYVLGGIAILLIGRFRERPLL